MLQIKINKEVKDVKENFLIGLNLRQLISAICSAVVAVIIYFALRNHISKDMTMFLVILCDAPIVCFGFITYQGMYFEQLLKEAIQSYIFTPKVLSNLPVNTYKAIENEIDYYSPEAIKKRKLKTIKNSVLAVILSAIAVFSCVFVSIYSEYRSIEDYKQEQLELLTSNYPNEAYYPIELEAIVSITESCRSELSTAQDVKTIDSILYSTSVRLNTVKTSGETASEQFKELYLENEYVANDDNLRIVVNRLSNNILNTTTVAESETAYNNSIKIIEGEIEAKKSKESETNKTEEKKDETKKEKAGSNEA